MSDVEGFRSVQIWLRKACSKEGTRKEYVDRLKRFLDYYNVNPDEIIERWKRVRYDARARATQSHSSANLSKS